MLKHLKTNIQIINTITGNSECTGKSKYLRVKKDVLSDVMLKYF